MPSLSETRPIHEELLILLKKFDELCAGHGISYSLHGGTLLGAIREQGFIPWDDDADLTLTRAEYEKLRNVLNAVDLGPEFKFREFAAQHPRLWMRREGKGGVWLDLFIYDYISENKLMQRAKLLGCAFFLAFTKTKRSMGISDKASLHHGLKRRLLNIGYQLGRPFKARTKARMMNFFCKRCFCGRRTLIHRANDQYSAIGLILPKGVMESYRRVPFEHLELMVSDRSHEILVSSYGKDYMTPKRYAGHDAFVARQEPSDENTPSA